jgi:hypothetical protein
MRFMVTWKIPLESRQEIMKQLTVQVGRDACSLDEGAPVEDEPGGWPIMAPRKRSPRRCGPGLGAS